MKINQAKILVMGALWIAFCSVAVRASGAETVEEKYGNGQVKLRYDQVDGEKNGASIEFYENGKPREKSNYRKGELSGKFVSYYENGKAKIKASYKKGQLNGKYNEFDEKGKRLVVATYIKGKLNGTQSLYVKGKLESKQKWVKGEVVMIDGQKAYPRSKSDVERALKKIYKTQSRMKGATKEQVQGLRRMNAYRYLAGVSAEVRLDESLTGTAIKVAKFLNKHGGRPGRNPGLDENEFARILEDTMRSAYMQRVDSFVREINHAMVDVPRGGSYKCHGRMGMMNPATKKVGLGREKSFFVRTPQDVLPVESNDWKVVCYPSPGYIPVDHFMSRDRTNPQPCIWTIAFNLDEFKVGKRTEVKIYPLDDRLRRKERLKLKRMQLVDQSAFAKELGREFEDGGTVSYGGYEAWIEFQPEEFEVKAGDRYWVEVSKVKSARGRTTTFGYLVEFTEPIKGASPTGSKDGKKKKAKKKKR